MDNFLNYLLEEDVNNNQYEVGQQYELSKDVDRMNPLGEFILTVSLNDVIIKDYYYDSMKTLNHDLKLFEQKFID